MAAKNTAAKTAQAEPAACTCSQFATDDGRTTGCAAETKRLFSRTRRQAEVVPDPHGG
ncbi:hypothetical protein SMICM304S_05514 [Streptomyces microflavus]